jgi:hypothetical protein
VHPNEPWERAMSDFEITAENLLKKDVLFRSNGPLFTTDKEERYLEAQEKEFQRLGRFF